MERTMIAVAKQFRVFSTRNDARAQDSPKKKSALPSAATTDANELLIQHPNTQSNHHMSMLLRIPSLC